MNHGPTKFSGRGSDHSTSNVAIGPLEHLRHQAQCPFFFQWFRTEDQDRHSDPEVFSGRSPFLPFSPEDQNFVHEARPEFIQGSLEVAIPDP